MSDAMDPRHADRDRYENRRKQLDELVRATEEAGGYAPERAVVAAAKVRKVIGDMKHGLTTARPKLSIIGQHAQVYTCRGMEYGADKYARGNYHGDPPAGVTNVDRFLGYVDAALRHLSKISQAINVARGTGGDEAAACAAVDGESSAGFPPSMLPHLAHAMASLMIAAEVGVADGLVPPDPGQPWTSHPMYAEVLRRRGAGAESLAQKDDPDSERARIARLTLQHDQELAEHRVANGAYDVLPADVRGDRFAIPAAELEARDKVYR